MGNVLQIIHEAKLSCYSGLMQMITDATIINDQTLKLNTIAVDYRPGKQVCVTTGDATVTLDGSQFNYESTGYHESTISKTQVIGVKYSLNYRLRKDNGKSKSHNKVIDSSNEMIVELTGSRLGEKNEVIGGVKLTRDDSYFGQSVENIVNQMATDETPVATYDDFDNIPQDIRDTCSLLPLSDPKIRQIFHL